MLFTQELWMFSREKCVFLLMKYLNLCWKLRLHKKKVFFIISLEISRRPSRSFSYLIAWQTQFSGLLFIFEFRSNNFVLLCLVFSRVCILDAKATHNHLRKKTFASLKDAFGVDSVCICGVGFETLFLKLSHLQTYFVFTWHGNSHTEWKHNSFLGQAKSIFFSFARIDFKS